jgi:hypothetical protein
MNSAFRIGEQAPVASRTTIASGVPPQVTEGLATLGIHIDTERMQVTS